MTGGPANSGCLGWGEAGGMGEGWGDFFATILRMKPEFNSTKDFGMGNWANGDNGIRKYPVSIKYFLKKSEILILTTKINLITILYVVFYFEGNQS